MENNRGYTSTKIPVDIAQRIKRVINEKGCGYKSVMEFVRDATRRRLEELETNIPKEYYNVYNSKKTQE